MKHMPTHCLPQLILLPQLNQTNRAQLHHQMRVLSRRQLHFWHKNIQMLYILLLAVILNKVLSPSAFVYYKDDGHSECYEETEDDYKY